MEVALVRAVTIKVYKGGLSAFWMFIMKSAFFNAGSHDFSTAGITLKLVDNSCKHVWLDLHFVIADEAALHSLYCCKGSGGIKPCMLCTNIVNIAYRARRLVENDRLRIARCSNTCEFDSLVMHTSASVDALINKLDGLHATVGKTEFEEVEKLLGWNRRPDSAMWDPEFRKRIDPSTKATYDGMHCFFVSGVFKELTGQLVWHVRNANIPLKSLHDYVSSWKFPKAIADKTGVAEAFSHDRLASSLKAYTFKASASEGLGIYPILAQFCNSIKTTHGLGPHCECFLALARCIALWQRATRRLSTADELKVALVHFLRCYAIVYGPESMGMIKLHLILHLCTQFDRQLSCWVHERKHKSIKKYANEVRNTSSNWDVSVHRSVTSEHVKRLEAMAASEFHDSARLVDAHDPSRKVMALFQEVFAGDGLTFKTANVAMVSAFREKIAVTDIAMLRTGEIGKVKWHVAIQQGDDVIHNSCVQLLRIDVEEERIYKCRFTDEHQLVDTDTFLCSLVHAGREDQVVSVIKPLHCLSHRAI